MILRNAIGVLFTVLFTGLLPTTAQADARPEGVGMRTYFAGWGCTPSEDGWHGSPYIRPSFESGVEATLNYLRDHLSPDCRISLLSINGEIAEKTYWTLSVMLEALNRRREGSLKSVGLVLNSPGGLIDEAMKIGDLIAKWGVSVIVFPNDVCASACIFIYAAAQSRSGSGAIGIHRPHTFEVSTESLSYTEYLEAVQKITPDLKSYFAKYGVSPALVDAMNVIPSDQLRILSPHELKEYGLGEENVAFKEYERARTFQICGEDFVDLKRRRDQLHALCRKAQTPEEFLEDRSHCDRVISSVLPSWDKELMACEKRKAEAR